ncbi:MAG: sel1 repeat family protein [Alphaproteobacteria bacterium]|nr:sel1 repeat family protein [Alphaproteobacteria bacterium]
MTEKPTSDDQETTYESAHGEAAGRNVNSEAAVQSMSELKSRIADRFAAIESGTDAKDDDVLAERHSNVEAALARLAGHVDDVGATVEQTRLPDEIPSLAYDESTKDGGPEEPVMQHKRRDDEAEAETEVAEVRPAAQAWNEQAAEELTMLCEDAGLSHGRDKGDLLLGDDGVSGESSASVDYVYLQPDANEIGQKWFEDRFAELAARFDGVGDNGSLAPLMDKFDALEQRLDAVLGPEPGEDGVPTGGALHDIELCIAEIATQLEATTTELKRIEAIESQISEISRAMASPSRAGDDPAAGLDVNLIAEMVADRLGSLPAASAATGGGSAGVDELSAVIKDFVRERRSEGEHANAVLDSMQQTIMRLLDRMEALESNGQRAAIAMPHPPTYGPVSAGEPAAQGPRAASGRPNAAPQGASVQRADVAATAARAEPKADGKPVRPSSHHVPDYDGAAASINRLQRAVGELENSEPATASGATTATRQASGRPAPSQGAPRSRADFIASARAAAQKAGAQAAAAADPLEAERTRLTPPARNSVADMAPLTVNDDAGEEIDATHDGFSLGSIGARLKPSSKMSGRARLLVAALAIIAVGLGATKYMMSVSGDAAREHLQSDKMQQGSSYAGDKDTHPAASAAGQLSPGSAPAPTLVHKTGASSQNDAMASAATDRLTEPASLQPEVSGSQQPPVSGMPGAVSRKELPPIMVGPLSLRLAAANGNASAEFQVASRLADGRGVTQDFEEAVKWYQRSASQGFALSQYRLGTLHERGLGVPKDAQRARVWYERAAGANNIKAMHNLAVLAAGSGAGKPDYVTAAQWFMMAADRGLADSQFNLAILYQNGLGVPQDDAMAYKWFSLAAATGDAEAGRRTKELAKQFGKKQLAELDREVADWVRKPTDKLANDPHYAGQVWQRSDG